MVCLPPVMLSLVIFPWIILKKNKWYNTWILNIFQALNKTQSVNKSLCISIFSILQQLLNWLFSPNLRHIWISTFNNFFNSLLQFKISTCYMFFIVMIGNDNFIWKSWIDINLVFGKLIKIKFEFVSISSFYKIKVS